MLLNLDMFCINLNFLPYSSPEILIYPSLVRLWWYISFIQKKKKNCDMINLCNYSMFWWLGWYGYGSICKETRAFKKPTRRKVVEWGVIFKMPRHTMHQEHKVGMISFHWDIQQPPLWLGWIIHTRRADLLGWVCVTHSQILLNKRISRNIILSNTRSSIPCQNPFKISNDSGQPYLHVSLDFFQVVPDGVQRPPCAP